MTKLFKLILATSTLIGPLTAVSANTRGPTALCQQISPRHATGYMAKIEIFRDRIDLLLGTGRIDHQGDGSMALDKGFLERKNLATSQNEAHKAKSSQWKNSRAFDLKPFGLLYIEEKAFSPDGGGEFKARLKLPNEQGGSREFILFCSIQ